MEAKPSSEHQSSISPLIFVFLFFNLLSEIYRCYDDPKTLAFAVVIHLNLITLFLCFNILVKVTEKNATRRCLKAAVWFLSTTLYALFAYRLSSITPFAVVAVFSGFSTVGSLVMFYACFVYDEGRRVESERTLEV